MTDRPPPSPDTGCGGRHRPRLGLARSALGIACLSVCWLTWSCSLQPYLTAARADQRARAALDDDDFPAAVAALREVMSVRTDSAETAFTLARTCRRAGEFAGFAETLEAARRLGWVPELLDLEAHLAEAQRVGPRGANEAALSVMVFRRHPDERFILEALADGSTNAHYLAEAGRWLNVWVDHFPDDWRARLRRGRLNEGLGHGEDARADFRRLVELRPGWSEAHRRYAGLLLATDDITGALTEFNEAVRLAPDAADACIGLAGCQRLTGDATAARATLERVFARHGEVPAACLLQGRIDAEAGRTTEAIVWLRRAEARTPWDRETLYQLLVLSARLGNTAEAARYEKKLAELAEVRASIQATTREALAKPTDPELRCLLGDLQRRIGNVDLAERWYTSALVEAPSCQRARTSLAQLRRDQ